MNQMQQLNETILSLFRKYTSTCVCYSPKPNSWIMNFLAKKLFIYCELQPLQTALNSMKLKL